MKLWVFYLIICWEEVAKLLNEFREAIKARNESQVHDLLIRSVSGFKPYSGLKDLIHLSKNGSNRSK